MVNDYDYINGGAAKMAILTANSVRNKGLNVYFFAAVTRPEIKDLDPEVIRVVTHQHDILTDPNKGRAAIQGIWNRKAAAAMKALLSDLDPEETVVHIHGWIKALSCSIIGPIHAGGFKVVCSLHDYFLACPNGGFYHFQEHKVCHLRAMSLQCICTNCDARSYTQKLWRVGRHFVQNQLAAFRKKVQNYILVSPFSEQVLERYLPEDAARFMIPNPVELDQTIRRGEIFRNRAVCVGRLSVEKGIHLACAAAVKYGFELTVIGDGPEKETLMVRYPEVDFRGWMNKTELVEELRNAALFIFPSLLYETQGLAVEEALALGVPVVVADVAAASGLVDGRNGSLFKAGDVDSLGKMVLSYLGDQEKLVAAGAYAFRKYHQNPFPAARYTDKIIECYHQLK